MEKGKHQVGYSGQDSMREKAQKLFGNAVQGVDMTDVLSASAPSKTPMRKYAKGGHVKGEEKTMRQGSMLPKSAKGAVMGGTLTDMHMPKKVNTKAYKKGGLVRFEGEHADAADNMHARQATKSKLSSMMKGTKANAMHPINAMREQPKIGMRGARQTKNTDATETSKTLRSPKVAIPRARPASFKPGAGKQMGEAVAKRAMKEGFAKGGHVQDSLTAGRESYLRENERMGQDKFRNDSEQRAPQKPSKSFGYESPAAKSLKSAGYKKGGPVKMMAGGVPLSKEREKLRDALPSDAYKKGGSVKEKDDQMTPSQEAKHKKMMEKYDEHALQAHEARKRGEFLPDYYKKGGSVKKAMGGVVKQETDRGPIACKFGIPKAMPVDHAHGQYEELKKGGKVRAKTTSPMRKAVKGRTKNVDESTKKGNVLDVGSVKQNTTPKKASMLKPKAASNGDKNSKLNVESPVKMNGMKRGGKC